MPLMASKLMFLAHCWQKSNAHTQKVGNDRMLSLKSCCRHLRHWSFYHIVMLVLKAKHLSDYYWVCSKNFPKQRKPEAECKHVSFCVCACLAGFSECFGIHLHEDKRKELRKLKKIKQGRIMARISWLRTIIGKAGSNWKLHLSFSCSVLSITLIIQLPSPRYHTLTISVHQSAMTNILFTSKERSFNWFWVKRTSASRDFWLEECYDWTQCSGGGRQKAFNLWL